MSSIEDVRVLRQAIKRRILVIGTGGTIASEPSINGYTPVRAHHSERTSDPSLARDFVGEE